MRKLGQCSDDYYDVNFVRLSQLPSNFLRIAVLCVLSLNGSPGVLFGQDSVTYAAPRELHKDRLLVTSVVGGTAIVGSLIALDQAWYAQYDRAPMHSFDDGDEWLQVDKAGHMWTTYTVGRWGMSMLDWCGTSESTSRWVGGSLGLVYMTGVELLDGTSAGWGFSWWDMAANVAGTGLLIGQDLAWRDQRITLKFSAHLTPFAAQNPELLGSSNPERILKDYNGQTYWLSANLKAFAPRTRLPAWLNVAGGYGGESMINAHSDGPGSDAVGNNGEPFRQYFLSVDVDLTRIRTRSPFVRTLLFALNCIKVPAPALEFRSDGRVLAHGLYF